MKFSEIEQEKWQALKPYLDTVILPITGLTGIESPDEATKHLESLRDWLDAVETPFHGRVVTYPAFHFITNNQQSSTLSHIVNNFKLQGYKYVVAVASKHHLMLNDYNFDAIIMPSTEDELPIQENVTLSIMKMWQK